MGPSSSALSRSNLSLSMERMYQKNKDIHLALLDHHNTPQQGQEHFDAQRLLSHCTKGTLSMMPSLPQPAIAYSGTIKTEIEGYHTGTNHYHDRNLGGVHDAIQPGQWVCAKPNPQNKHSAWPHGIEKKMSLPRSYAMVSPHRKMCRNQV